jgi:gamma-glutamyltranspeptidase/glutathione hydrolase
MAMRIVRLSAVLCCLAAAPAGAASRPPVSQPVEVGTRGAVATVDPYASRAALGVLRNGGNAIDAAVAGLAALGVVEPYSTGIGGGGFMVIRTAGGKVVTIDGRETGPASLQENSFIDPSTGSAYPFNTLVTSGLGVGVPGAVRAWEEAIDRYGKRTFRTLLKPAIKLARGGFVVDATLNQQTRDNLARFQDFTSTAAVYLTPAGEAPATGSTLTNPDMANTLQAIADGGADAFYSGPVAADIAATVQNPPVRPGATRTVLKGGMTAQDIAAYDAIQRAPTRVTYRGLDVYGMGPPSSGGSTVGEALNILSGLRPSPDNHEEALHAYQEALALSFADRNAFLGDPAFTPVPLCGLISTGFADARRALITGSTAARPVAAGDPAPFNGGCPAATAAASEAHEGPSTSHLTVADAAGNVVSATFTIEQTGGSGIVVPGRGFLLNNELTDFDTAAGRPNSPAAGKRPRSSMAPTIVLRDNKPYLAVGSPGGATIISTVLQVLVERIDLRRSLAGAIEAPRVSDRNGATADAEPAFMASPERTLLEARGHKYTQVAEIGAATGIEFLSGKRLRAVAEARRRGGGSAMALP